MSDYYKNLTEKDLQEVLDLNASFNVWNTYYNSISSDLYFVGIKKADINIYKNPLPIYSENGVIETSAYINHLESLEAVYSKYDTDKNTKFHTRFHSIYYYEILVGGFFLEKLGLCQIIHDK